VLRRQLRPSRIDARFVFGQFERYDGDRALVRLATGLAAAPRDRDQMARSCVDIAMLEVLNHLPRRRPGAN
jgi:hypothetical protein